MSELISTPSTLGGEWSVRPAFVSGGPTEHLQLRIDDRGLTQVGGTPESAWQIPWDQLHRPTLVRHRRGLALFATVAGVRYRWSSDARERAAVVRALGAHGITLEGRRRRFGPLVVALIVVAASTSTLVVSQFHHPARVNELSLARAANLSVKDLPSSFTATGNSVLADLVGSAGEVATNSSTTTMPAANSAWYKVTALFQQCLGVSARADRMYGAAGQLPDDQVTGTTYASALDGGIAVVSSAQYYATTTMVRKDRAEMARANFGSCFATSQAAVIRIALGTGLPTSNIGTNWQPRTFAKGFAVGGLAPITAAGTTFDLAMAIVASGHYEVTVAALVANHTAATPFLNSLVNTVKARVGGPTGGVAA